MRGGNLLLVHALGLKLGVLVVPGLDVCGGSGWLHRRNRLRHPCRY
jgi:hypothetical protein